MWNFPNGLLLLFLLLSLPLCREFNRVWHLLWEFFDQYGHYHKVDPCLRKKKPKLLDWNIFLKVCQLPSRLVHLFSILQDQKPLTAHSIHLPNWSLKGKLSQGETAKSRSCAIAIPNHQAFKIWPAANLSWLHSIHDYTVEWPPLNSCKPSMC